MPPNHLPPLNPLHVFAVAAESGSFAQAAAQLNVTQSAVSRQIATLEGNLGIRLFDRTHRGVMLTEAGEAYRREIAPAFHMISNATRRVRRDVSLEPVRVAVYSTFAAKWLIKRLPDFERRYPDVLIQMTAIVRPADFSREDIDLAIQLGPNTEDGSEIGVKLFRDVIQPICSPALIEDRDIAGIGDLSQLRLLHSRGRPNDWLLWLDRMRRDDLMKDDTSLYPSSLLAYEAAANSVGVAIGQVNVLKDDFVSGTLTTLFEPVELERDYYVAWSGVREPNRKARAFIAWLRRRLHADIDEAHFYS